KDEAGRRDGPGFSTRLIGQDHAHSGSALPVSIGCRSGKALLRGLNELAFLVLELRPGQVILLGISVFDVADGVLQLANVSGNAFVTLATLARGPLDGLAFADLVLPVGRYLGQVVGPVEGRAGTVRTVHHDDRGTGQLDVGVQRLDGFIIPLGDLAQIDIRQHFAREAQFARLDAVDVDDGDHTADDGGELQKVVLLQVFSLHRIVGCAEVDRLGDDLLLTPT